MGKPSLSLAHHMDHFDAVEHDPGTCHRLKTKHQAGPACDAPVVLLNGPSQLRRCYLPNGDRPRMSQVWIMDGKGPVRIRRSASTIIAKA